MYTLLSAEREYQNGRFNAWVAYYQRANVDLITTLYIPYKEETSFTWFTDADIRDANNNILVSFNAVNLLDAKDYWVTLNSQFPTMNNILIDNVQVVVEQESGIRENVNASVFTEQVDSYILDHISKLDSTEQVSFLGNKYVNTAISDG